MELAANKRIISLQGGLNFRDLGGYRAYEGSSIRWGSVYRSGATHSLDAADLEQLASLGIRAAVDLRSNRERTESPHGLLAFPDVLYSAHDHDRIGGRLSRRLRNPDLTPPEMRSAMLETYRELPYEFREIYRQLFLKLAHGPLPLVFNCAAGKDRTGVAAALLLSALGVNWDDTLADYMLSQQFLPDLVKVFRRSKLGNLIDQAQPGVVNTLFGVDPLYLEAMREAVMARSGSFDEYLASELGLNSEFLETLRRRLLDEGGELASRP